VKICGITCVDDALAAAYAGADAIGLVFYRKSPRFVSAAQAKAIISALPPFVTTVGLFVDASRCEVDETLDAVPLDLLQFHGDEVPAECARYRRPYMKALRMKPGEDIAVRCREYVSASAILLDTYVHGVPGGTGQAFDWALIPEELSKPVILAGGLNSENVIEAIAKVRPYAVDVSGGVEVTKGIKDHEKIQAFVKAVRYGQQP
jgi:phosphoribosylanthranilate isomerase